MEFMQSKKVSHLSSNLSDVCTVVEVVRANARQVLLNMQAAEKVVVTDQIVTVVRLKKGWLQVSCNYPFFLRNQKV